MSHNRPPFDSDADHVWSRACTFQGEQMVPGEPVTQEMAIVTMRYLYDSVHISRAPEKLDAPLEAALEEKSELTGEELQAKLDAYLGDMHGDADSEPEQGEKGEDQPELHDGADPEREDSADGEPEVPAAESDVPEREDEELSEEELEKLTAPDGE